MSAFDPVLVIRAARRAAWLYTPRPLEQWREDIAADVVEYVLRDLRHSPVAMWRVYRWGAWHAVRRLSYLLRGQTEELDGWDEPVEPVPELGPIALWRLQRVWEDLTDLQRLGLAWWMSGDGLVEVARRNGVHRTSLVKGLQGALRRIDEPAAFTKRARTHQRTDLSRPRPPTDPALIDASRLRDRDAARRRRAACRVLSSSAAAATVSGGDR